MNGRCLCGVTAVVLASWAMPVLAHHSFASGFDINKPVSLKGKLTKMEWTNPHGWIYMDVIGADGKAVNWAVEAGAPNALIKRGLKRTDFPVGSEIVVDGYQAKNRVATANGITVTFNDGRNFLLGSSGTGAPTPPGER